MKEVKIISKGEMFPLICNPMVRAFHNLAISVEVNGERYLCQHVYFEHGGICLVPLASAELASVKRYFDFVINDYKFINI